MLKILVSKFFALILFIIHVNCKTITVSSAEGFQKALTSVSAGDKIHLNNGKYNGQFNVKINGKKGSEITIEGSENVIISSNSYAIHLTADYYIFKGFTINGAKKGIILDNAHYNLIDRIIVKNIEDEAIHFRKGSTDNTLSNSRITNTGMKEPGFGEGLYIGSAVSNWGNDGNDKSDRNKVIRNHFGPNVAAEAIDIKEGTCCGIIKDNTFDGHGMSGANSADSWIHVKGDNYVLENNSGDYSLGDGFQVHYVKKAGVGGCGNKFRKNKCNGLKSGHKCVAIDDSVQRKCGKNINIIEN